MIPYMTSKILTIDEKNLAQRNKDVVKVALVSLGHVLYENKLQSIGIAVSRNTLLVLSNDGH